MINHAPYGTSVLEPARRIWRQLTLLGRCYDGIPNCSCHLIVVVFKIDVGGIAPQDVEQLHAKGL